MTMNGNAPPAAAAATATTQAAPPPTTSTAIVPSVAATLESYRKGLEPTDLDRAFQLAEVIASTRLCGITTPQEALTRIMTGRELGLTAMQSIRGIYTVEGRPGLDAALMHGLCIQSPECEDFHCIEDTATSVTYYVKRRGRPKQEVTWTMDDARRAKLVDRGTDPSNNNWNKYPRQMLHARCKSELARREFPDRLFGLYSVDELRDGDVITVQADPVVEPARLASASDAFAKREAELLAAIDAAVTVEQVKRVRDDITAAKSSGELPPTSAKKVTDAYKEKFGKKKDDAAPAQAATASPPVQAGAAQPAPAAVPPVQPTTERQPGDD